MATALPAAADFTGAAVTEGDFKAAMTDLRAYLNGLIGDDGETATARGILGTLLADSLTKSGAYTVVAADRGKAIVCTGTWTLSLTSAATLGDGFACAVYNAGSGTITIDPYLTENIDGSTTKTLSAGQMLLIYCTATEFVSVGGAAGGLLAVTTYTSNGTHTTNALAKKLVAFAVGGGGAGGGEIGILTDGGEGGQPGAQKWAYTGSPSASYSVTIGAGGTGTSAAGNAGSNTTVGALLTAEGGSGGYSANTALNTSYGAPGGSGYGIGGAGRTTAGTGNAASANTGAGGGGAKGNGSTPNNGGAGGSGIVIIWEFA